MKASDFPQSFLPFLIFHFFIIKWRSIIHFLVRFRTLNFKTVPEGNLIKLSTGKWRITQKLIKTILDCIVYWEKLQNLLVLTLEHNIAPAYCVEIINIAAISGNQKSKMKLCCNGFNKFRYLTKALVQRIAAEIFFYMLNQGSPNYGPLRFFIRPAELFENACTHFVPQLDLG